MSARRRRPTGQDGVGALAAVAGAAAAVVVVAGGGWAIARSGGHDSTPGATGPNATSQSNPSQTSPGQTGPSTSSTQPSGHKNASWSHQCAKAAGLASHHGFGVLAPSELPSGWSLRSCRYSAATGWHMVVSTGHTLVMVDQRSGDASALVQGVLGSGSHQGKDFHAQGTGTWQSWSAAGGRAALSRSMTSTGAVISGHASVRTLGHLADVLLTYENAPAGNNGG